jgi:delta 1-pyrroline-5-carboxylate dehydrogenase
MNRRSPEMFANFSSGKHHKIVASVSGKIFELINPTTEEKVIDISGSGDEKDVDIAVQAAKTAFKTWKDSTSAVRARLLYKVADLIPKYQDEIGYLDAISMGHLTNNAHMTCGWQHISSDVVLLVSNLTVRKRRVCRDATWCDESQ